MPGLTPQQQYEIREKAHADAERMWNNLQPLASSPSTQFAERPLPIYKQFVTSRPAPVPDSKESLEAGGRNSHNWSESIRVHSRKISDALSKPLGYEKVNGRERSPYEMQALMDPGRAVMGGAAMGDGKLSADSFSVDGSDGEVVVEGRDSGKTMGRGVAKI
jgi:hypothetical protein